MQSGKLSEIHTGDEIRLRIDDITSSGWGLGRLVTPGGEAGSSIVVFIPDAAPSETVIARVKEVRSNHIRAELLEVVAPHPARRLPPCPFFTTCPGCSLQYLTYDAQLDARVKRVSEIYRRVTDDPDLQIDVVQSPEEFAYRTHISVRFEQKDGVVSIGFTDPATRRVVDIPECLLIPDWANERLTVLRERLIKYASGLPANFNLRLFMDYKNKDVYVTATRGPVKKQHKFPAMLKPVLEGFPEPRVYKQKIAGVLLRQHPAIFSQADYYLVEKLYTSALEMAKHSSGDAVLELYSGSGFFTLALAPEVREVIAVEADRRAIDNLEKSANDLTEDLKKTGKREPMVHIYQGRAEEIAPVIIPRHKPSIVIANPPRSGVDKRILDAISAEDSVKRIVIISCDPATCARDIRELKSGDFKVEKVVLLDCYPQTAHMETIVSLVR